VKVLFDTSVLVAALIVSHPKHESCFDRLKAAESGLIQGFISTHSLAELYSVITRLPVQPHVSPEQAQKVITEALQYLEMISLLPSDYQTVIAQVANLNLPGGSIFDALIAQAALKAKVDVLMTLNPKHFIRLGTAIANLVQVP
jgi:predicted nucleic acid-binding protein